MQHKILYLIIFIILLSTFMCGKEEVSNIEIISGIRVVHNSNPKWKDNQKITLEFIRKIGEIEGEDENYLFFIPNSIACDDEGNLYILDRGNFRIQKFDTQGNYVATIGRYGLGPAEFVDPTSLNIDSDGRLYIGDRSRKRIIELLPDGYEVRRFQFDESSYSYFKLLQLKEFIFPHPESSDSFLFKIYDFEGNLKRTIGMGKDYGDMRVNITMNTFYYAVDNYDNIYVTYKYRNLMEKYSSDGKLIMQIDRPLNYDTKVKVKNKVSRGGQRWKDISVNTISSGICIDTKGRIWVVTLSRQEKDEEYASRSTSLSGESVTYELRGNTDVIETDMNELEIFNQEGILLEKIPIKHFCNRIMIHKDRLFILDELHAMCVYVYKIIEK